MKTAKGPGNIAVQEIPVPELPDENWVLIEGAPPEYVARISISGMMNFLPGLRLLWDSFGTIGRVGMAGTFKTRR